MTSKKGFYSEAFLVAGDDKQVVIAESSPLEYWLATTDPLDLRLMERISAEHPEFGNLELLEMMARKFPNGASVIP